MMESEPRIAGAGGICPVCGKPVDLRFRPFCSARCAEIDLGRWFGERYRVASDREPGEDQAERADKAG